MEDLTVVLILDTYVDDMLICLYFFSTKSEGTAD